MFIRWNNNNVHAFGSFDGKEIHWLRPGWNEFPSHIWKVYESHKDVKKLIEDKKIELLNEKVIVEASGKGKGKKKTVMVIGTGDDPVAINLLPEHRAIEIIGQTFNREILQRWLDDEMRSKVKKALDKQIEPLTPGAKAS